MKKLVLVLTAILVYFCSFSQSESTEYIPVYEENFENHVQSKKTKIQKPEFSFEFGTGINIFRAKTTNFYNYLAPLMRFKLNSKWSINAGIMYMNTFSNGMYFYNGESFEKKSGNFSQAYLYTSIDYQATEKLRISGEIMYGTGILNSSINSKGKRPKSFSIQAEYKITDFLKIGIGIRHNENYNPYRTNIFGASPYGNRYSSPFPF